MAKSQVIVQTVGRGGKNRPDDMAVIQGLLNDIAYDKGGAAPPFFNFGNYGANAVVETAAAIGRFQKNAMHMGRPDEQVAPGGPTWRAIKLWSQPRIDFKGSAILVIPAGGSDSRSFEAVAHSLRNDIYGSGQTTVLKTTVASSGVVTFKTANGAVFSWDHVSEVSRVLTISHATGFDGPIMAMSVKEVPSHLQQPWPFTGKGLTQQGRSFWGSVGRATARDGKIILLGCNLAGSGGYAKLVAQATRRQTFGFNTSLAAGDPSTVLEQVYAIESGHPLSHMVSTG